MNNQIPYFMPINNMQQPPSIFNNENDLEKIINKLNRLEKNIRILENRINKLEGGKYNDINQNDDPTDMYII